ncbi:MAG: BON domain-containing protein [Gammaproteobacteria bacterium]|nr:BON domain-containing protein [Gammaproteobacteria bacterium]
MNKKFLTLTVFTTLFAISGCMNVAVTGAQATYNRYNLSNSLRDQYITMVADRKIHWYTPDFKDSNISVSTLNCVVVITGEVASPALRKELTDIVKKIPDVDKVYNLTTITNAPSTLTQISDGWITTKIKAQLIAENEIDPSQIKVITENGTVYLIGIVFPEQADIAADIARKTSGVQSVVKIFSYLKITKLKG